MILSKSEFRSGGGRGTFFALQKRETDRETQRDRDRKTETERDTHTERQRHRESQTDRDRDIDREDSTPLTLPTKTDLLLKKKYI